MNMRLVGVQVLACWRNLTDCRGKPKLASNKKGEAARPRHENRPGKLILRRGGFRHDVDAAARLVEGDLAVHEGEQRPVATGADVLAGDEFRAALADEDAAGGEIGSGRGRGRE